MEAFLHFGERGSTAWTQHTKHSGQLRFSRASARRCTRGRRWSGAHEQRVRELPSSPMFSRGAPLDADLGGSVSKQRDGNPGSAAAPAKSDGERTLSAPTGPAASTRELSLRAPGEAPRGTLRTVLRRRRSERPVLLHWKRRGTRSARAQGRPRRGNALGSLRIGLSA